MSNPEDFRKAINTHRKGLRRTGFVLIALGLFSILFPLVGSIAAKVMIGWLFLLGGASMLWLAFQARSWNSALWTGGIGALNLALGVYLAFFPLTGLVGLTFLMAILFLIQGAMECAIWLQNREGGAVTGWVLFSGLASVVLGILLIAGLPGTALWALGLMVGINLLTSGMSLLALTSDR